MSDLPLCRIDMGHGPVMSDTLRRALKERAEAEGCARPTKFATWFLDPVTNQLLLKNGINKKYLSFPSPKKSRPRKSK